MGNFKKYIYFIDGALRDIYIFDTTREDWKKWIFYVNENYKVEWENPETGKSENKIDFSVIEKYWDGICEECSPVKVFIDTFEVRGYFFETNIENDISPREIISLDEHKKLIKFMKDVSEGKEKLNIGTLFPYEIITPCLYNRGLGKEERLALDSTWKSLPNYTNDENALVVVDGSGSMYGGGAPLPIEVVVSLGVYFAQRNKGHFADHFITFSERPSLIEIKGNDIFDQVRYCMSFNEVANTNVAAVFDLILNTAIKNKIPQEDLSKKLFFISDMEFDNCAENADISNFDYAKNRFNEHGYQLPQIVFWNIVSRNQHQPVSMKEQRVALVSGCTPRLFQMVTSGKLSPYENMLEILSSERYAHLEA